MRNRLIIDGNAVYEIDDECMKKKQAQTSGRGGSGQSSPMMRPGQERGQGR